MISVVIILVSIPVFAFVVVFLANNASDEVIDKICKKTGEYTDKLLKKLFKL